MRIGDFPENAYKRSVRKYLHPEGNAPIMVSGQAALHEEHMPAVLLQDLLNRIYAKHAVPAGIAVSLAIPVETEEPYVSSVMRQLKETADAQGVLFTDASVKTCAELTFPILQISAVGKRRRKDLRPVTKEADILLTGHIALAGTGILTAGKKEELGKRFSKPFLETAEAFLEQLSVQKAAKTAFENGAAYAVSLGEGGVFAGLWELSSKLKTGFGICLKAIPIRQETVEISEFFRLNPYQLLSTGSILIVTDNGQELKEVLNRKGIHAELIGKLKDGNDKTIENDGEIRHLDLPAADELYKGIKERE